MLSTKDCVTDENIYHPGSVQKEPGIDFSSSECLFPCVSRADFWSAVMKKINFESGYQSV